MALYYDTNQWGWGGGGQGIVFLSTNPPMRPGDDVGNEGQFYLWSPLMIFSLVMAIVVGVLLIGTLLYALFYCCMYGTCCWAGAGGPGFCFCCPPPPAPVEEPVKIRMRRPSRSESCRSSVRSRRSSCSHYDDDDRKIVRINSCPSISESCAGAQQPLIIQTIPAVQQQAPQVIQALPPPQIIQAPPMIQAAPTYAQSSGGFGGGEIKIVIGDSKPASSRATPSNNVIVYDMGGRGGASGGGITLGGSGGGGRSEYVLTSVDDNGGNYKSSGAFNEGFERDDGSFLSDGPRSAIIDIGRGGGNFYPTLPRYDD